MKKKDRHYESIIKGCNSFEAALEEARKAAELLNRETSVAEATLKDRVAKKNIDAIRELCDTVLKTTAAGEERVRELGERMKSEKSRFEELER